MVRNGWYPPYAWAGDLQELEAANKVAEGKVNDAPQFKNMKAMLAQKNELLRDVRDRLRKYEVEPPGPAEEDWAAHTEPRTPSVDDPVPPPSASYAWEAVRNSKGLMVFILMGFHFNPLSTPDVGN